MSRKQTIVIAVLINAGLLVILFTSALKTGYEPELPSTTPAAAQEGLATPLPEIVPLPALPPPSEPPLPVTSPLVESPFAEELKSSFVETPSFLAPMSSLPSGSVTEVTVKKGDVLEKIARTHHTSVDELIKRNRLTNTQLKIGQVLQVPSGAEPSSSKKYYTVRNGDNPWTIAVKNHMKLEELLKLNGLNQETAKRLKPGDQLRIQ